MLAISIFAIFIISTSRLGQQQNTPNFLNPLQIWHLSKILHLFILLFFIIVWDNIFQLFTTYYEVVVYKIISHKYILLAGFSSELLLHRVQDALPKSIITTLYYYTVYTNHFLSIDSQAEESNSFQLIIADNFLIPFITVAAPFGDLLLHISLFSHGQILKLLLLISL